MDDAGKIESEEKVLDTEAESATVSAGAQEVAVDESLQRDLESIRSEFDTLKDKYLRLLADFDNYRRRSQVTLESAGREGEIRGVRAVLPALDDLERALTHADDDSENLRDGLQRVIEGFERAIASLGVSAVPGEGEPFDPSVHEAVGLLEGEDDDRVAVVYQRGWRHGDQLIRPARVLVTRKKQD